MYDRHDEELIDIVESALDSIFEAVDSDVEDTIETEKELLLGDDLDIPILDDEEEILSIEDMTDEELAEIEAEADEYVDGEDDSDDIELDEEISDEDIVDENYMLII
jgi:hypothetical protein